MTNIICFPLIFDKIKLKMFKECWKRNKNDERTSTKDSNDT